MIAHWGPQTKGHVPHHVMLWPGVVRQQIADRFVAVVFLNVLGFTVREERGVFVSEERGTFVSERKS